MSDNKTKLSKQQWDAMDSQAQLSFIREEVRKIATEKGTEAALNDAQVQSLIQYAKVDSDTALKAAKEGASAGEKSKGTIEQNKSAIANAASTGTKTALTGSAEEQKQAKDKAAQEVAAQSGGGQTAVDKAKAAIEALTNNIPEWVLSLTGGSTPNAQQKKKIIDTYNVFFKGQQIPDNVNDVDLWSTLGTVNNGDFVKAVNNNINSLHEEGKRYVFPTGDSFFLSSDRYKAAVDGYAANEQTIDMAVNMAHALGLTTDGAGPQNTMWQPILAIATALGKTGANVQQDIRTEEQKPPSEQAHTYSGSAADRPLPGGGGTAASQATASFVYNEQLPGGMSVYDAAKKFQANLTTYNGDRGLAMLATFDKGLADRFLANGRKFLDPNDVTKAAQIFLDTKWGNVSDVGLASEKDAKVVEALLQGDTSGAFGAASGSGGSGQTIQLPDPEKVKQAAQDMWKSLFLTEAPAGWADQQLQDINNRIMGRESKDTNPNTTNVVTSTDPAAQLLEALRQTPLYQTMYGHKQPGQTEEQYAGQFQAAAGSMLGNQAPDIQALQAGMQTGQYQTTVGAIAGSAGSLQNSTFMERLARAAQAVNQYT